MTYQVFIDVLTGGLWTLLKAISPILLVSLLVGLVISFFQAVTQIHEQTLTFAPKILVVFLMLIMLAAWILQQFGDYAYEILPRYLSMI